MKIKIQGYIELDKSEFGKLSNMMLTKPAGHRVTYMGVVLDKVWLSKKALKELRG